MVDPYVLYAYQTATFSPTCTGTPTTVLLFLRYLGNEGSSHRFGIVLPQTFLVLLGPTALDDPSTLSCHRVSWSSRNQFFYVVLPLCLSGYFKEPYAEHAGSRSILIRHSETPEIIVTQAVELLSGKYSERNRAMAEAYRSGHYTLQQMGERFGMSYATVSPAVKALEEDVICKA